MSVQPAHLAEHGVGGRSPTALGSGRSRTLRRMGRAVCEVRGVSLEATDDGAFEVSDPTSPKETFGPDELDVACAALFRRVANAASDRRLRRRFTGAATALGWFAAINRRDWPALLATVDPALVVRDHRPVGIGTITGAAAYVETIRQGVELIPDAVWRMKDLLAFDEAGRLALELQVVGSIDGGDIEMASLAIATANESGLTASFDIYAVDQHEAVVAQFSCRPETKRL